MIKSSIFITFRRSSFRGTLFIATRLGRCFTFQHEAICLHRASHTFCNYYLVS